MCMCAVMDDEARKKKNKYNIISIHTHIQTQCQLELPPETTLEALRIAKEHGVCSILNPAPAPEGGLDQVSWLKYEMRERERGRNNIHTDIYIHLQEFLSLATIVCPNESELAILTGMPVKNITEIRLAAAKLLEMGMYMFISIFVRRHFSNHSHTYIYSWQRGHHHLGDLGGTGRLNRVPS